MERPVPLNSACSAESMVREISWEEFSPESYAALQSGTVIILRGCSPLTEFRDEILETVECEGGSGARVDIKRFYEESIVPSAPALLSLSRAVKLLRTRMALSRHLAPVIQKMECDPEVLLDGGINRIVVPPNVLSSLSVNSDFASEDFKRKSADGDVEIFMPGVANIHRDFNRPHHLFQFNIWFPLHSVDQHGVLRIWPNHYRAPVTDLDATEENFKLLGDPLPYRLDFGDAILFHGEHLHTSPVAHSKSPNYRRHTYDFRVASCSYDDNTHYRQNFWNVKNFLPKDSEGRNDCSLPYQLIADVLSNGCGSGMENLSH